MRFHGTASGSRFSDSGAYELRPTIDKIRGRRPGGWTVWHGETRLGQASTLKAAELLAEEHAGTTCQRVLSIGRRGRVHRCGRETAIGDMCRGCVPALLAHQVLKGLCAFIEFGRGDGWDGVLDPSRGVPWRQQ